MAVTVARVRTYSDATAQSLVSKSAAADRRRARTGREGGVVRVSRRADTTRAHCGGGRALVLLSKRPSGAAAARRASEFGRTDLPRRLLDNPGPGRARRRSRQTRGMLPVSPRAVAGYGAATARLPWTPPARPSPARRWSQTPPQSERARRVGRPGRRGAERRRRRRTAGTGAPAPRGGVGKARALSPPSAGSRLSAVEGWLSQRRSERRRDENVHTAGITASAR